MATEPIQAGPYPVPADAPDGPTQIKAVVDWAAPRLNMRFATTTARDAAIPTPTEGMECTTGTGATLIKWAYVGTGWQDITVHPPTAYTPVLTASTTSPTMGTGAVLTGRYIQVGKLVTYWFDILFGTSGVAAGSGYYIISLPVPSTASGPNSQSRGSALVTSAGLATVAQSIPLAASTMRLVYPSVAVNGTLVAVSAATPGTFTNSDWIRGFITYEAA